MKLLEKHFEIALETPDGITRLRELILKLAMQGKLAEQNFNTQTAKQLLQEIKIEKDKLIKEGLIKKQAIVKPIVENEIPYKLPKNWEWTRLRAISHDWGQKIPNKKFTYIDVGSINNLKGCLSTDVLELDSSEAPSRARKVVKLNTIIYSTVRPYLLNIAIIDKDFVHEPIASTAFAILHPYSKIEGKFIYYYLHSRYFIEYVELMMKGVAYPAINDQNFYTGYFPLPPLEEQKRIVKKIDQLMLLCDKLEAERDKKNKLQLQINSAGISNLIKANDEISFNKAWNFIANQFATLYTTKQNVTDLKDAIINLAIKGKLISKDIKDEETEIISSNKYIINEKDYPFSLPKGWKWLALNDLGLTQTGTTPATKNAEYYGNFMPFIGPGDIKNQVIDYTNLSLSKLGVEKARLIPENSIMMVCIGGSIGKLAINNRDVACNQQINTVTPYHGIDLKYLFAVLQSSYFKNQILLNASGSATPIINKQKWISIPVPVPPYQIQKRISKQVDDLFKLCNDLENKIEQSSNKQSQLLNAILAQV
jgi:type I restriction enzyme S subunit